MAQTTDDPSVPLLTHAPAPRRDVPRSELRSELGHPIEIPDTGGACDPAREIARMVARLPATAFDTSSRRTYLRSKRLFDLWLATAGLILCAPLMLVIALLVRLESPGPALFVQPRVGERGRIFRMYKFRTMRNGSRLRLLDQPHKSPDDDRITRVGRALRALSLDELPQLYNVLRGDMSLVGPRPEIPEIVLEHYQPWQYRRFLVPQGMTGWWQVTGRGNRLMHLHTEDDLHYIAHASFWFDLKILARTLPAVLHQDGAF